MISTNIRKYKNERNKVTYMHRNAKKDYFDDNSQLATGMNDFFIQKISDLKSAEGHNNNLEEANDVLKTFLSDKEFPQGDFKLREITAEEKSLVGWTG